MSETATASRRPATRVRELRHARGWTQRELARRADLAEATVSLIETCRLVPFNGQAERIARALGVKVEELFS